MFAVPLRGEVLKKIPNTQYNFCKMKSFSFPFVLMLAVILPLQAQTLTCRINYEEVEAVRGELYQYSERYLGINNAIKESGITYRLLSVEEVQPDTNTTHLKRKNRVQNKKQTSNPLHLPALSEDALLASNTAKKAEIVAKQIYHIRDARMAILSGESEHAPADGKAMELTLRELNRQEEELTALFLGTTRSTTLQKTIQYTLRDTVCELLTDTMFRFSQFVGPVSADDLSGEPVQIVRHNLLAQRPSTQKKAKKGETETYITGSRIEIVFEYKTMAEKQLRIEPVSDKTTKNKK